MNDPTFSNSVENKVGQTRGFYTIERIRYVTAIHAAPISL